MVSTKYSTQRALGAKESDGQDRQQAMKQALTQVEKQFGKGAIMRLGESNVVDVDVIPTGCLSLDAALGIGGVPRGRVVEMYGPESAGKTMCALNMVAQAQKQGGITAFVDAEHALDVGFAKKLGVDVENLLVAQPDCGEEALEITDTLVRSGALDLIVVDSVAALVPKAELEGDMGMATMGMQARLMSQALRKLTAILGKSKTMCLFTNQMREKVGVMFGSPETTPGGKALKFYCSVRIDIRRREQLKDNTGNVIGNHVRAKVVKNKVSPPFTEAEFDIMYGQGINWEGDLIAVGLSREVIQKKGAWLQYDGEMIGQGKEAARRALEADKELAARIHAEIIGENVDTSDDSKASSPEETIANESPAEE